MKSWLKYTLRTAAILLTATLLTTSCLQSDFDEPLLAGDTVKVSFNPTLDNNETTRVGEGESIDKLLVAIYKQDGTFVRAEIDNATVTDGKISGNLDFELLRNQNYKAVFFAYNSTGYTVSDDFQTITANYSVSNPEQLDAFRGAIDFTATANTSLSTTLTRAVALFVVGAKNENFESGNVTLSLPGAPTAFRTLTGDTSAPSDISLTFTPNGSKVDGNDAYTLLAMTYVLPGEIQPTITTVDGAKQVANAITFAANKRYNLLGNSLFVNSSWGGEIEITSLPTENVDSNGWIHIKTAEELAYLIKNGDNATVAAGANISSTRADGVKKYHICPGADLDMSMWKIEDKPNTAVSFTNTIIDAGKWDEDAPTVDQTCTGGCYTIKGLALANGIFGNANGVTVQNLIIEGATIGSNTAEGVGIIANNATGSLTLTNITVSGTVTGANKVGGLVGYIGRSIPTDRADKSVVATFTNCSSSAVVTATDNNSYAGYLVGCLSGYDPAELLTFTNCSKLDGSTIINSNGIISTENKASFSNITEDDNHLLGGEIYRRGTIKFNDNQFFYRWDGTTNKTAVTIEPLLANTTYDSDVTAAANKYVVYSPFDLAAVRAKLESPAAIYLRQDVDMNGQGTDGKYNVPSNFAQSVCSSTDDNNFNPFSYVTTLDGRKSDSENYSIYNLSISQIAQERAAFILYASGTTYHQNINFRNCCTVAVHKDVATDAKAYGAIVCSNIDATYYMTNVHAYDCKVFALQKVGTLAARVAGTSTLQNCTVNNCYIENYQCDILERFSSGEKTIGSWTVTVYADFYPHGEVGGMFGFIQGNSSLTNCKVNGTTVKAYGQDDKMATTSGSLLARLGIAALGYYKVPGRHVSKMIGNIRATGTVKLTGCTVDGDSKCTDRWDKHNDTYDYIGQAYIVKYVDSEGTVTVDGKKLTLADCNKYTER